jgi:hypothetical protein
LEERLVLLERRVNNLESEQTRLHTLGWKLFDRKKGRDEYRPESPSKKKEFRSEASPPVSDDAPEESGEEGEEGTEDACAPVSEMEFETNVARETINGEIRSVEELIQNYKPTKSSEERGSGGVLEEQTQSQFEQSVYEEWVQKLKELRRKYDELAPRATVRNATHEEMAQTITQLETRQRQSPWDRANESS